MLSRTSRSAPPQAGGPARRAPGGPAARAAAHLACWAPFAWAAAASIGAGWVATSDSAVIAARSWSVLTSHAPLLGQATRLGNGLYDPGPLEYWLLALPVRLDPARGLVWGAALWCALACSVAVEAAWSVSGRRGGLMSAAAVLGALAWIPGMAAAPYWNPWFGMIFFLAALAASWAVIAGRRGWWPVAVVAGSAAAQAHLMFAVPSAVVVLGALGAGVVDTCRARRGWRWAAAGLAAGLTCWSAPLLQQITHRNGNLAALVAGHQAPGPASGAAFGLRAVAAAAAPPPLWWQPLDSLGRLSLIDSRPAAAGAAVLALTLAALAVSARPLRSRPAAALAATSLLVSVGAAATYAGIPAAAVRDGAAGLRYLMAPLLAVGVLCWLAAGSAAALGVRWMSRRGKPAPTAAAGPARAAGHRGVADPPALPPLAGKALAAVLAAALAGAAALTGAAAARAQEAPNPMRGAVAAAAARIERALPAQPVALTVVGPYAPDRRRLTLGLAYALTIRGYRPEVTYSYWARQLGRVYVFRRGGAARVTVSLWGGGVSVAVRPTAGG